MTTQTMWSDHNCLSFLEAAGEPSQVLSVESDTLSAILLRRVWSYKNNWEVQCIPKCQRTSDNQSDE